MSKSLANATRKHGDIIAAATTLFLQQGYGASGMDRIAELSGVTKQTVYRYFPSKEELFMAVMAHVRKNRFEPYEFGDRSLADELNGFGVQMLAFHLQPEALGLYRLMLSEGAQENLNQAFTSTGPQQVIQPLITFLQQRCGTLEDIPFHARMFATMVLAPRNQQLTGADNKMHDAAQRSHVEKVVRLFIQGINP
ncbi:MAG: TetR/AcrR family transcriptional regulator [Gammaproteobacteria bacterium]|nr:TetR/AcrR family transcriptional regulator [Gammaproteobacteria bacterium]